MLSHRTGFPRMGMLWANDALSSEEVLRRASRAEPLAPFRQQFHYNNVQYQAAGRAAAAAAGRSGHALIRGRILELRGDMLEQLRLGHPAVICGDWRRYFESVSVVGEGELDGRVVHVVRLQRKGRPATTLSVGAATGDVLRLQSTLGVPGLGAMPVTTT